MNEEFDFERECEYMQDQMFTLYDGDGSLSWIPLTVFTDKEKQQIENELYELSKDNTDTGSHHPIDWKFPLRKAIKYYNKESEDENN